MKSIQIINAQWYFDSHLFEIIIKNCLYTQKRRTAIFSAVFNTVFYATLSAVHYIFRLFVFLNYIVIFVIIAIVVVITCEFLFINFVWLIYIFTNYICIYIYFQIINCRCSIRIWFLISKHNKKIKKRSAAFLR